MHRIEKVFQIPRPNGLYENIKVAVEGEDPLALLTDIYTILYMDRLISAGLNNIGNEEEILEIIATVKKIEDDIREILE